MVANSIRMHERMAAYKFFFLFKICTTQCIPSANGNIVSMQEYEVSLLLFARRYEAYGHKRELNFSEPAILGIFVPDTADNTSSKPIMPQRNHDPRQKEA